MHVGVRVGFAEGLHAGAKVASPVLFLRLLDLVEEDVAADGRRDDDSHRFQSAGSVEEGIVSGLYLLLKVERKVGSFVEVLVDFRGRGTVGALSDGIEQLFDRPIIDQLVVGTVGGAENRIRHGDAESFVCGVSDGFLDADHGLVAGVDPLRFLVSFGACGDLRFDGGTGSGAFVYGFLAVVLEDVVGCCHVG